MKTIRFDIAAVAWLALAIGGRAFAQPAGNAEQPAPTTEHPVLGVGIALTGGGGFDDFVSSAMRATTGVGFGWTVRGTIGTHSYIAGELSYIGSAQSIDRLGFTGRSTIYGNGAQAALRINGTVGNWVQPFVYGGVAWRHYSLDTSTNFSDVSDSTDTFEVPVGAGVAMYSHNIAFDLRGEYRFGWSNHSIVPEQSDRLDRWAITSNGGIAF